MAALPTTHEDRPARDDSWCRRAWLLLAASGIAATLCGCDATLPPLPEIVLVVDTDLPIALAASQLRVDLYTEQGDWFESSDIARPDPQDWPVSFGIYSDDPTHPRRAWVRLRAYIAGKTRAYRGEKPNRWSQSSDAPLPPSTPLRLLIDGNDVTPTDEPEPVVTVDRLALIELLPDLRQRVSIVLRGACVGTSAVFGADPDRLVLGEAQSCIDEEKTLAKVTLLATDPDSTLAAPSLQGTWLAEPACPPRDDGAARVCVPGGATVLGTTDLLSSVEIPSTPVRVFGLRRFFLDRDEITVGEFRHALAEGLMPTTTPLANAGALGTKAPATCTWSSTPLDREAYPLNCVSWATAREFCLHQGGDLPTEAQWEHAATIAGHGTKVDYPWGNEEPDCDRAAFGRVVIGGSKGKCVAKGPLPPPAADSALDVSPLGLRALGAGLSEWVLDTPAPFTDACWKDAPLTDPRCGDPTQPSPKRLIRGANYILPEMVHSTIRFLDKDKGVFAPTGFRCAYPEARP